MTCPRCQTANPVEANFCLNCGIALTHAPLSATMTPPPALFSPTIHPTNELWRLSNLAQRGERRVVTIMFADLSGFTALSENMDPEQLRNLMNSCFDHLVPIIEKYEGVVDKFIGDEIMALFGAPIAHEDDPVRALRAALEMMAALTVFNERHETGLGMHIGVNTGLVVAGGMGSKGRQQYSVIGDTVNLAARLEDLSERGEILVGTDTYRRAAPLFEFERLAPVQVKGKAQPVEIYNLRGLKAEPERGRGLAGLRSPLVGRDAELVRLMQAAETVRAGQGQAVLIIGEAGLGKSRLVAEWRAALTAQISEQKSLRWSEGRCLSYGQGLAYHLLIDWLRSLIGVPATAGEPETRTALAALIESFCGPAKLDVYPYLGHLLSLQLEDEAAERLNLLDPQARQSQYLTALRRLLQALAAQGPLALIFEDIHWADPSSVDILAKLLPLVSKLPLLFCFVTRPEPGAPGWSLAATARDSLPAQLTELTLHTLSETDSRSLIAHLLEIESLPDHIRSLILKRAEGNPFFVEEVTRMLIDQGAIVRKGEHWVACQEIETVEIPENLQGLLLARIDRLPEEVKDTLRLASVLGRQFSVKVLEEMTRSVQ